MQLFCCEINTSIIEVSMHLLFYVVRGGDYVGAIRTIEFESDGEWDVLIGILDDTVVEETESFLISLSSSDSFVVLINTPATVNIVDNDGMLCITHEEVYISFYCMDQDV